MHAWAVCCSGMMLDDITHRNQKRKRHFLCQILLIISLEYPSGSNVNVICKHVNQCPLTATFVCGSVCVGEGRNKRRETVINTQDSLSKL